MIYLIFFLILHYQTLKKDILRNKPAKIEEFIIAWCKARQDNLPTPVTVAENNGKVLDGISLAERGSMVKIKKTPSKERENKDKEKEKEREKEREKGEKDLEVTGWSRSGGTASNIVRSSSHTSPSNSHVSTGTYSGNAKNRTSNSNSVNNSEELNIFDENNSIELAAPLINFQKGFNLSINDSFTDSSYIDHRASFTD